MKISDDLLTSSVTLESVQHEDEGVYTCEAVTDRDTSKMRDFTIEVRNSSQMLTASTSPEIVTGSRVILDCHVKLDERLETTSSIKWSKDNVEIDFRYVKDIRKLIRDS